MNAPNRCRIVLIVPPHVEPSRLATSVVAALDAGDVASLILPRYDMDETAFHLLAEKAVPAAQQRGVAAIIAGDTRIAGRIGADGIHVEGSKADIADAIERHGGRMMVGTGGAKTRDDALNLGELQPDYLFFGRFGYDNQPGPHPRNLNLGQWWSEMVSIPCIVLAGAETASVSDVAAIGTEFVALSHAVLGEDIDAAEQIRQANALLDAQAPRFEDA